VTTTRGEAAIGDGGHPVIHASRKRSLGAAPEAPSVSCSSRLKNKNIICNCGTIIPFARTEGDLCRFSPCRTCSILRLLCMLGAKEGVLAPNDVWRANCSVLVRASRPYRRGPRECHHKRRKWMKCFRTGSLFFLVGAFFAGRFNGSC